MATFTASFRTRGPSRSGSGVLMAKLITLRSQTPSGPISRSLFYEPFQASPTGAKGHALTLAPHFNMPGEYTGLPQTEMTRTMPRAVTM